MITDTGLLIDHVGVVVHDLKAEVAAWRSQGFQVSDPVPLMAAGHEGELLPLGQSSAHIVFRNGYVELSSPIPGSGNHLEPYLARGEGVRIVVLAADDAEAARRKLLPSWPGLSAVRHASRLVLVGEDRETAGFDWFPLPQEVLPGVLTAVVQHRSRDIVLHPSLAAHPNGWTRISRVIGTGRRGDLRLPALAAEASDAPGLAIADNGGPLTIFGLTLQSDAGREQSFSLT